MIPDPRPGPPWRLPGVAVAAVLAALLAGALATMAATIGGPAQPGTISVVAGSVRSITLQAPPGRLTITGLPASRLAAPGRVTVSGSLHWSGPAAAITSIHQSGHRLRLAYRCAAGSPCSGNLRLTVPAGTAIAADQPSGQVTLTALAGPLRITARSADLTAARLRCPDLAATITSGHLAASFAAPPRRLTIMLRSAQATVWLPGRTAYRLTQDVTAGYLRAAIPQASTSSRIVSARIDSGELELLLR